MGAQEPPARLPAVVVNAAPDKPGARKIAGVVRDTTGFPIDGVEITIASSHRRAVTVGNGAFQFENIAPGSYEVRARKLGYAPQVRTIVVDSAGGAGAFAMMPVPLALLPVISSAARGGLSGVVGDTAFHPLPGAEVHVVGHSDFTLTDSTGAFYLPVRPGNYTVSITQQGFDFKIIGVIVPPDSGRRITAYLAPQSHPPSVREVHNLEDFATRMAWRTVQNSKVFTRAELEFIRDLCVRWNAFCITDEIYEHILYDGTEHITMARIDGMRGRTIVINGMSKTYSVTGWRVGWAIAPAEATASIRKVHDFLTVGAAAPLQQAGAIALKQPQSYYDKLAASYAGKRARLLKILTQAGFAVFKPRGAYYIMTDISRFHFPAEDPRFASTSNDVAFAKYLVQEIGVACVPGSSFYNNPQDGASQVRFTFCKKEETLAAAEQRFGKLRI